MFPPLSAGNKDDLDDSDRLSSWSVLTHCTYMYLVFVQRPQSCTFRWCTHNWSPHQAEVNWTRPCFVSTLVLYPRVSTVWIKVPAGSNHGNTVIEQYGTCLSCEETIDQNSFTTLEASCHRSLLNSWNDLQFEFWKLPASWASFRYCYCKAFSGVKRSSVCLSVCPSIPHLSVCLYVRITQLDNTSHTCIYM